MTEKVIAQRPEPISRQSRNTSAGVGLRGIESILVVALVAAFVIHMTGLMTVLSPAATPAAMVIEYGVVAIYVIVAILRGHIAVVLAGLLWVIYLLVQCYVWHTVSGFPMNTNAVISYGTLLFFIVFFESHLSVQSVLKILLTFAAIYVAVYAVFWEPILTLAGHDSSVYLPSDGTRPARLYLAAPLASFTFVYGLLLFPKKPFYGAPLILISGYTLWLAQTRFATVLLGVAVLALLVGSIARQLRRTANAGLAVIFIALCSASLAGFFVPGWNLYVAVTSDSSGLARATEYQDGLDAVRDHVITGYGIPDSVANTQLFIHPRRPFYASDLGIAGLAMEFGLPLAFAFIVVCVVFITKPPLPSEQMNTTLWALFYTTQQAAFSTAFANTLVGGSATIFGAIVFALWLRRRGPQAHHPIRRLR